MAASIQDQGLALCGIVQAADIVQCVADTGDFDQTAMQTLCESLFVFDADKTEDIYGGQFGLIRGKRVLTNVFSEAPTPRNQNIMNYVNGMIGLEKQLSRQPELLDVISARLEDIERNKATLYEDSDDYFAAIALLYTDTVSTLTYRIKVTGSPDQLQIPANANKIRTALLCGIRSAILWRQLGGRRWKLLFQRGAILKAL